jgi:hypothetical protein
MLWVRWPKDDPPGGGVPFLRDQKVNSPIKIYFSGILLQGFMARGQCRIGFPVR